MAKSLLNCLPPAFAKEIRKNLGKSEKGSVPDKEVMDYMIQKGAQLAQNVEDAKLSSLAYARVWSKVMNYTNAKGVKDPKAGLKALLYTDRKEMFGGSGLEAKMDAIAMSAHAELGEMIVTFAPKAWGLKRNREFQNGLIEAMYGNTNVDNMYSRFAVALNDLNKKLVDRYNATGGTKMDYDPRHLPVESDFRLVKEAGTYKEWYMSIKDDLDLDAMGMTDAGLVGLRDFYQDIITDGVHGMSMDPKHSQNSFQKRYSRLRTLKFKTAEGWLKYNKMYSKETPFSAIMDNVTHLTKEIGIRETFGPSPDQTFKQLKNAVIMKSETKQDGKMVAGDKKAAIFAQKAYNNITMALNPRNPTMADIFQTARNLETGTKLTGATLSAMPDTIFNSMTARYNGLSAFKVMKRFVGTLSELGGKNIAESQAFAAKTGFLLEHALDSTYSTSRFGDVSGKNWTSRFAEAVMRGSGLNRWTIAGKQAFHMEFMSLLTTDFTKNKKMMRAFKRYGLNDTDISNIQNGDKMVRGGAEFLDPKSLTPETTEKVLAMISSELKYAVPEPDAAVQAAMNQGLKRGTVEGEVIRSAGQFKAFSVSIIMSHMARTLHGSEGSLAGRVRYGAGLITGATMLGVLTAQMKEISRGNKPMDWDSRQLWTKGLQAGGAMSIAGDLMLSDVTQYGTSLMDYLGGPLGGTVGDVFWDGLLGDARAVAVGDKKLEELVRETASAGIDYIPGQFWYTRLAFDRIMYDDLNKALDPKWQSKEIQREIKRRQESGSNERWW